MGRSTAFRLEETPLHTTHRTVGDARYLVARDGSGHGGTPHHRTAPRQPEDLTRPGSLAGHFLPEEAPRELTDVLGAFLGGR
jgi:hypothetical protein